MTEPRGFRRRGQWIWVYLVVILLVGVLGGLLWNRVVTVPSYVVADNYQATISQNGLAALAAIDAYFALVGSVCGCILGLVAWFLFKSFGWVTALIAAMASVLAGVLAIWTAEFIGPRGFDNRVAQANPGATVPVDFAIHTWTPLAMWVASAMIPVLVGSILGKERKVWIDHTPLQVDSTRSDSSEQ